MRTVRLQRTEHRHVMGRVGLPRHHLQMFVSAAATGRHHSSQVELGIGNRWPEQLGLS